MTCDNIHECHDLETLKETTEAIRVFCNICRQVLVVKKNAKGDPEPRRYAEIFRKEILQPGENLYYKYHHAALRTTA